MRRVAELWRRGEKAPPLVDPLLPREELSQGAHALKDKLFQLMHQHPLAHQALLGQSSLSRRTQFDLNGFRYSFVLTFNEEGAKKPVIINMEKQKVEEVRWNRIKKRLKKMLPAESSYDGEEIIALGNAFDVDKMEYNIPTISYEGRDSETNTKKKRNDTVLAKRNVEKAITELEAEIVAVRTSEVKA